jgi:hypothetical protein
MDYNIKAQKVMLELRDDEPKMQVYLPSYLPLKTEVCHKCNTVIAEQKEFIRVAKKVTVCLPINHLVVRRLYRFIANATSGTEANNGRKVNHYNSGKADKALKA